MCIAIMHRLCTDKSVHSITSVAVSTVLRSENEKFKAGEHVYGMIRELGTYTNDELVADTISSCCGV
jgi:NADPH-dependent curcumin reductase CurA